MNRVRRTGLLCTALIGHGLGAQTPSDGPGTKTGLSEARARGLRWLVTHQLEDGRWQAGRTPTMDAATARESQVPVSGDLVASSLAVLALLGAGNSDRSGPYRDAVQRGVLWLCVQQNPDMGWFGCSEQDLSLDDHALVSLALVECYILSRAETVRRPAQLAVGRLEQICARRVEGRESAVDDEVSAGWAAMAIEAARFSRLAVDRQAATAMQRWVDARAAMRPGVSDARGTRKALDEHETWFATHAHDFLDAESRRRWRDATLPTLLARQRGDGGFGEFLDPAGSSSDDGGRVLSTALACMTMASLDR
jgi:hypothetical protein